MATTSDVVLDSFFDSQTEPEHYSRTDAVYVRTSLMGALQPRGIYNKELFSLIKHLPKGAYIAGGFISSILNREHKSSDIDIFFNSCQAFWDTYQLLCNPPEIEDAWALRGYIPDVTAENLQSSSRTIRVVSFKHPDPTRLPIQLVKMVWFGSAEHVIDSFDFTATQFAVEAPDDLILNPLSLIDIYTNNLIIHRHQFPAETLYRLLKYTRKGYNVSPRTIAKIVSGIREAKEIDPPLPFQSYE